MSGPASLNRLALAVVTALLGTVVLFGDQGAATLARLQAPARPAQQEAPAATFRTNIEAVQVDVYVTDEDDQPVAGLTADDFEIFEDGVPQRITTFTPVSLPVEREEPPLFGAEPDVQSNNRPERHVYLFILSGTSPAMALRTRHLVREFIEDHFGDHDIGAVITGRTYPGDRQDFTSNRRLLLTAVDRFAGEGLDIFELADLMEMTAKVPGARKVVLWFGGSNIDTFQLIDYQGGVLSRNQEAAHAAMAAATRGNIRFYMIDPNGLTIEGGGMEARQNYRALGEMTGGFALVNSNQFTEAFEQLVRETSEYYLLGFESTGQQRQGRYVELEVRVKRPGLTAKSRTGYLEELQYRRRRRAPEPQRTPVEAALANPVATAGVPMRVFAAPFKQSGKNATVTLAVDLDASQLEFTRQGDTFSADVELRHLATDVNHKIYPEYRHQTRLGLNARSYPYVVTSGVRILSEFEVPTGRYQIRIASASGDRHGSVVYDLEVPDFRDGVIAMSGIAVTTRTKGYAVSLRPDTSRRSTQKSKQCRSASCGSTVVLESTLTPWTVEGGEDGPALLRDVLPAPPTTAREFAADETLVLFAEVYDNNGGAKRDAPYVIELDARLYGADGQVARTASAQRSSRDETRRSGGHGFTLDLPLDDAPAGRYVLQVDARTTRDPAHRATRTIPIRVR